MNSRQIVGIVVAVAGLGLGIAAVVANIPFLGLGAGIAAVAAGGIVLTGRGEYAPQGDDELDLLRAELHGAKADLAEEREQHDKSRQALADYLAINPPAGSFERKFDEAAKPAISPKSGHSQTDANLLADPETSLFSEAYFRVALDSRIASARRHLRPVAVAILDVGEGIGAPTSSTADPKKVTGSIRQTLRDADTACRMADGCYALILEDTPENGAVWTVERIRRNLTSRYGHHTVWAGVACYPAHAFSTDEILDQASLALEAAREWKQDRIEVATAD